MQSEGLEGTVFISCPPRLIKFQGTMGHLLKCPVTVMSHLSSCSGRSQRPHQKDSKRFLVYTKEGQHRGKASSMLPGESKSQQDPLTHLHRDATGQRKAKDPGVPNPESPLRIRSSPDFEKKTWLIAANGVILNTRKESITED